MTAETRELVLRASLNSASNTPFAAAIKKHKQQEQQHQQKENDDDDDEDNDGPIYSLSPSPKEDNNESQGRRQQNFSKTFVSSSSSALGKSRHLNFDTTSMMQQ